MEHCKKDFSYKLFSLFQKEGLPSLFKKIETRLDCVIHRDQLCILTVTDEVCNQTTYAVSISAMIFDYSKDELIKIKSKTFRKVLLVLIKTSSVIFRFFKVDRNIFLNNYIFSTNFFNEEWESIEIESLVEKVLCKYKDYAILLRSVNEIQNQHLFARLQSLGWLGIVSRQVYVFDDFNRVMSHHNTEIDLKLLESKEYFFRDINIYNFEEFQVAEKFYNKLYIEKYSENNIQYTAQYLYKLSTEKLIQLSLLVRSSDNKPVGVVGLVGEGRTVTAPVVGYDTDLPKKEALYRRIMIYTIKYASDNNLLLNLSSGASDFKMKRGGLPKLEFMFVYVKHLPLYRRIFWRLLYWISRYVYIPILLRLKL